MYMGRQTFSENVGELGQFFPGVPEYSMPQTAHTLKAAVIPTEG